MSRLFEDFVDASIEKPKQWNAASGTTQRFLQQSFNKGQSDALLLLA
jgi:hypothetical protein